MKSHELAKMLLSKPDMLVVQRDNGNALFTIANTLEISVVDAGEFGLYFEHDASDLDNKPIDALELF